MSQQTVCKPQAYSFFAEQLPQIETTQGLLNAAIAISMHALDHVVAEDVDLRLLALASRVSRQVRGQQVQAAMAHLHHVLFEEEGLAGNQWNYYTPLNSYLPTVLESKRGIPATLSLIYKVVGERVGLQVEGVNSPWHFLCRVRGQRGWMIIDPYFGGAVLSRREAFARLEQVAGRKVPHDDQLLAPASHRDWLARILTNLQVIFDEQNRKEDFTAMSELKELLTKA